MQNIANIRISLTVLRKGVKIINIDNGQNRTFEQYWMKHCNRTLFSIASWMKLEELYTVTFHNFFL